MPLRDGYGFDVVQKNAQEMIRAGYPHSQALAAAYSHARSCFFKRYPHGALPSWLAYPRKYRMREHYDKHGNSVMTNVNEFREQFREREQFAENPSAPNPRRLEQAAKLFEDFTGRKISRVTAHNVPSLPKEGLVFGRLIDVGYESERDGKPYRHTFRKRSRPLLVATPDGKMVLIVGGRYAFTDRGIEDR